MSWYYGTYLFTLCACAASSLIPGLPIGLVLAFVLIAVIVAVVVVVVRKKRPRRHVERPSIGPHVSIIGVAPADKGEYEYVNPIPFNGTDSLPSDSFCLSETGGQSSLDSQYITVNNVNPASWNEHRVWTNSCDYELVKMYIGFLKSETYIFLYDITWCFPK